MFVVVALALLAPIGYLLFLAMSGADLVDVVQTAGPTNFTGERYEALPWLAVATVAAITALGTWWIDRRRAGAAAAAIAEQQRLAAELEHVAAEVERLEGERDGLRGEVEERRTEFEREQGQRALIEKAHEVEREWAREMRKQVTELHKEHGVLGNPDDIRELVLRIGITLLDAKLGMLLSRDRESDGDLELIAARGFENDPEDSALAQRFATEVIERDQTIREDEQELDPKRRTEADQENGEDVIARTRGALAAV